VHQAVAAIAQGLLGHAGRKTDGTTTLREQPDCRTDGDAVRVAADDWGDPVLADVRQHCAKLAGAVCVGEPCSRFYGS